MPIISQNIDKDLQNVISSNSSNSFGNQVLYAMCKQGNILYDKILADEFWLIGRSYAASPERRFFRRVGQLNKGRGTGDYFAYVAKYIVNDARFVNLVSNVRQLTALQFDCSATDFSNLCTSIKCVEILNELIVEASKDYDAKSNPKVTNSTYKNQISFCSKFWHFQSPENFFIIDQYTEYGANQLFSTNCKKLVDLYGNQIKSNERKTFANKHNTVFSNSLNYSRNSNTINAYQKHAMYSYSLGVILKRIANLYSITKSPNVTYPRLTDIVFQNVL